MAGQTVLWLLAMSAALVTAGGCERADTQQQPPTASQTATTQPAAGTQSSARPPATAPGAQPVKGAPGWEVVRSGVSDDLHAVAFASDRVGVAVGANRTVIRTEDGGRTWTRVMGPDEGGTGFLAALVFTDENNGWLRNNFTGDVHRTVDGGRTWKRLKIPNEGSVYSPSGFSAHSAAAGTYFWMNYAGAVGGNALYATTDGSKWDKLWDATPYLGGDGVDLVFTDATTGWMSSRSAGTHARYFVGRSTDGGREWQQAEIKDKVSGNTTVLHAVDRDHAWFSTAANFHVHATDDGGKSWIPYELGNGTDNGIRKIQFLDAQTGHVLCTGGATWQVRQTADGGKTWRGLGAIRAAARADGMFFRSRNLGWVVGSQGYIARYDARASK
jgi:photosystem II stability/assembly factor-like uncharacterized protein